MKMVSIILETGYCVYNRDLLLYQQISSRHSVSDQ